MQTYVYMYTILDAPYTVCETVTVSDAMDILVLEMKDPVDLWWMQVATEPIGNCVQEQDLVTVSLWDESGTLLLTFHVSRLGHSVEQNFVNMDLGPGGYSVTARCGLECRVSIMLGYDKIDESVDVYERECKERATGALSTEQGSPSNIFP